jgi:hypothetical protein
LVQKFYIGAPMFSRFSNRITEQTGAGPWTEALATESRKRRCAAAVIGGTR